MSSEFGLQPLNDSFLHKLAHHIAPVSLHPFLRRNIITHHRDFDVLLKALEEKKPLYIYTGRGPSSASMHLGHLVPFLFTRYLQQSLRSPVVIQITDDEKFLFRGVELSVVEKNAQENIKDIMACGFDPDQTFVFQNTKYIQALYPNILRIQSKITNSQCFATFGIKPENNIGQTAFCAIQAAPAFASSFAHLDANALCLIPCGIDQDPYFRLTRDVAPKLGYAKPLLLCSEFLPSLKGVNEKMSSTVPDSAIFLTDTPTQIASKIKKSFSGGQVSKQDQLDKGADLSVDVAYQYLRFFLEDDAELDRITQYYGPDPQYKPKMMCSDVKKRAIEVVTEVIQRLQVRRDGAPSVALISPSVVHEKLNSVDDGTEPHL